MCIFWESEVWEDSIHGSPLIHQDSDFIIEAYQIGQAGFPLTESLLTATRDFLLLHMPGNGF